MEQKRGAEHTRMAIQVRRRKEAKLLHQKAAPWSTNTRWVMVMVVVVTVGYHDAQQIHGDRRKNESRGEDRDEQRDGTHLGSITWWGEYDLTQWRTPT
jgi:hypothetical protein